MCKLFKIATLTHKLQSTSWQAHTLCHHILYALCMSQADPGA